VLGGLVLVGAIVYGTDTRPFDGGGVIIATAAYVVGLHWIIAYWFDGTIYGALRLQPTNRAARAAVFVLGIVLVFFALQYALGLGGPLA
jgi:hypothetical protein